MEKERIIQNEEVQEKQPESVGVLNGCVKLLENMGYKPSLVDKVIIRDLAIEVVRTIENTNLAIDDALRTENYKKAESLAYNNPASYVGETFARFLSKKFNIPYSELIPFLEHHPKEIAELLNRIREGQELL